MSNAVFRLYDAAGDLVSQHNHPDDSAYYTLAPLSLLDSSPLAPKLALITSEWTIKQVFEDGREEVFKNIGDKLFDDVQPASSQDNKYLTITCRLDEAITKFYSQSPGLVHHVRPGAAVDAYISNQTGKPLTKMGRGDAQNVTNTRGASGSAYWPDDETEGL